VPVCEKNDCGEGNIKYNDVCTKLESHVGCKQPKGMTSQKLFVDATTLQLKCGLLLASRGSDDSEYYEEGKKCFEGGKRECEIVN
jgi:hypothetical protein